MVKKNRLWRKTLSDAESTKAAAAALFLQSQISSAYTVDTVGDVNVTTEIYPSKFAKPKVNHPMSKSDQAKLKSLPVKRQRSEKLDMFDLWAEECEAPATVKSHIPAVINPQPGQSYRPEKIEHEQVLEQIVNEELQKEIDREKHNEIINGYRVVENDPSPEQSEDDIPANFINNPPVKVKYLTTTKHNIKERNKLKEKLKKLNAINKKSQKQLDRVPEIMNEIQKLEKQYTKLREEKSLEKKMKIELEKIGEMVPNIRMGKFKYRKPETVADITPSDNLRKMHVKGNSVEERLDSFIRRKMVDLYKPKDKKPVVIKDCSQNEKEIEYTKLQQKKAQEILSGNISLAK